MARSQQATPFSSRFPRLKGKGLHDLLQEEGCGLDFHGVDLLERALRCNPFARPSVVELLRHSYFCDIKSEAEVLSVVAR